MVHIPTYEELFSDTESESDYSEYESDHEEYDPEAPQTDWRGNSIVLKWDYYGSTVGPSMYFYPISAYLFSRRILKEYKYNRRVARIKTGYDLPLTRANIKGQVGRIHKKCSQIMCKKGRIVFP